jgi:hypothetical protein
MHRNGRSDIKLKIFDSMIPLRLDRRRPLLRQIGHDVAPSFSFFKNPKQLAAITAIELAHRTSILSNFIETPELQLDPFSMDRRTAESHISRQRNFEMVRKGESTRPSALVARSCRPRLAICGGRLNRDIRLKLFRFARRGKKFLDGPTGSEQIAKKADVCCMGHLCTSTTQIVKTTVISKSRIAVWTTTRYTAHFDTFELYLFDSLAYPCREIDLSDEQLSRKLRFAHRKYRSENSAAPDKHNQVRQYTVREETI